MLFGVVDVVIFGMLKVMILCFIWILMRWKGCVV